ncbi:hypothetical protein [Bulleidia sp. zg-1006]|uniref:hypothetical protein n=1 Tax=Bulleidia sp. zg-1006 TaxID=2806552 RepID=UPI00193A8809|nr:hypothetical protein [Bulleidia sp. zg-1006]QRG86475.1 hypothetical protein JOS54_06400 [Bulleidia sp. zg-1006]
MDLKDKLIALMPEEEIKKIPFFVREHATGATADKIMDEHPDLMEKFNVENPSEEVIVEIKKIISTIFDKKMKKHGFK